MLDVGFPGGGDVGGVLTREQSSIVDARALRENGGHAILVSRPRHGRRIVRGPTFSSVGRDTVGYSVVMKVDMKLKDQNQVVTVTRFFCKQRVYKHTQPQIREILSTFLNTPPASDFEIDNKIFEKLLLFPKISEKTTIFFQNFRMIT